jgi:hypothetical protein
MEQCLNCGTPFNGTYCHNCGQKKIIQSDRYVYSFIMHFFEEFFTFDAKFFKTIKYLTFRPGFLTNEYINGKVIRYVSPLKMYLFLSFMTFLVTSYTAPENLESIQQDFPEIHAYVNKTIEAKNISYQLFSEKFNNEYNGKLPLYILVMVVLFSLPLKLIYITSKRYYVEHLVFALHFYSFILICATVSSFFTFINFDITEVFMFLFPFVYLFIAVKNVYKQGLVLTFFESLILFIYYFGLLLFGWLSALLISLWRI